MLPITGKRLVVLLPKDNEVDRIVLWLQVIGTVEVAVVDLQCAEYGSYFVADHLFFQVTN